MKLATRQSFRQGHTNLPPELLARIDRGSILSLIGAKRLAAVLGVPAEQLKRAMRAKDSGDSLLKLLVITK